MNDKTIIKKSISHRTLSEQIYEYLRQQILTGKIEQGARLGEQRLSAYFQVSATPVREAVRLLHGDGLIELEGRHGAKVISPNDNEVSHAFAVRIELECLALREAYDNLENDDLTVLQDIGNKMWQSQVIETEEFFDADWEFHKFFQQKANNVWLTNFLGSLKDFLTLVRSPYYQTGSKEKTRDEHTRIIDSIISKDIKSAEALLRAHIERVCKDILLLRNKSAENIEEK